MQHLHYALKLTLLRDESFFGPGVAELLQRTARCGSLHAACAEMHMAYSKAWRVLKKAEAALGYPLLNGRAGGAGGGHSSVTPEALAFLARYEAFNTEMQAAASKAFARHFAHEKGQESPKEAY